MNIQRIQRPKGFTSLCHQSQTNNKQEKRKKLRFLLQHYILSNHQLNKQPISLLDLSQLIHTNYNKVLKEYLSLQAEYGTIIGNDERKYKAIEGGLNRQIFGGSEIQAQIMCQLAVVQGSQGNGYKAWVTPEITKLLDLALRANKTQFDMYMALMPKAPAIQVHQTNTQITNKSQTTQNVLSIADATTLIQAQEMPESMALPEGFEALPEVVAIKQISKGEAHFIPQEVRERHLTRREDLEEADIVPNDFKDDD